MTSLEQLEKRRKALGMSRLVVARRSCVPLPMVNEILRNQNSDTSDANLIAVLKTLGMNGSAAEPISVNELRHRQARQKAKRLIQIVQGTSALEGQALNHQEIESMISKTTQVLLSSNRKLWAE